MTETAGNMRQENARPENARQELEHVQTWARALGEVLGQITSAPVSTAVSNESPPEVAATENDVWILAAFSGGLRGELALRLPAASAVQLARVFMSEPGGAEATNAEVALTSEHREAALELMRQIAGLAATALKSVWGEVQLRLEAAAGPPSWPASAIYWLRAGSDSLPAMLIELHLSAALAAALRTATAVAGTVPSPIADASTAAPANTPTTPPSPVNLDLLMEVELGVTLRFGSRRLLLREILDLNPGSVIDLDRQVEEPVEMLLDGRLLARGEVVVMNGCYGLRVTEVAP
jgi:flagellar motor switch protein FliN